MISFLLHQMAASHVHMPRMGAPCLPTPAIYQKYTPNPCCLQCFQGIRPKASYTSLRFYFTTPQGIRPKDSTTLPGRPHPYHCLQPSLLLTPGKATGSGNCNTLRLRFTFQYRANSYKGSDNASSILQECCRRQNRSTKLLNALPCSLTCFEAIAFMFRFSVSTGPQTMPCTKQSATMR